MQRLHFVEVVAKPVRVKSKFVMDYSNLPVRLHCL